MKPINILILAIFLLSSCNNQVDSDDTVRNDWFPFITDVSRYNEVMDSFDNHPIVEHFPDSIPSNATQVKFAYEPRRMQGAMIVELLMTLPTDEIEKIENQYKETAKYIFVTTAIPEEFTTPILHLIKDENNELNDKFVLFVIDAIPAGEGNYIWNHGVYYGI